jgi:hypothetical protein
MNLSETEKRLDIARRLHQALVAQDPDRVIILCDSSGQAVASHGLRPDQSHPRDCLIAMRAVDIAG